MRKLTNNLTSNFCVSNLITLRKQFSYKICYKKKYKFLQLKHTPTYAIANRLMREGKFLKIYKLVKKFYNYSFLFTNFKKIPVSSNFLFFYLRYFSFRDSDRVFFWKYKQLDCMFANKVKKLKKKKQQLSNIVFLEPTKRPLLCINFIKYLILLNVQRKKKNIKTELFKPLSEFIIENKVSIVTKVKYKIYKQKLMQLQV